MKIECKTAMKAAIMTIVIMTILIQPIAVFIFIFADTENQGPALILELGYLMCMIPEICNLFRRCPVCGKRTLSRTIRCSGDRYTLYDADCRHCGSNFDITKDRKEKKTSYLILDDKGRWGKPITPIWGKNK